MSRVRETIEINAPIGDVYGFFDDIANASVLVPALVEITSVDDRASGRRVEYTVRTTTGTVVTATSEQIERDPPRRTVTRGMQSGIETTATREFVAIGDHTTRVTATLEWKVPIKAVAGLVTAPLRGPLRRSVRASLAAAKAAIER
jgi:uncharacterized membrane protein